MTLSVAHPDRLDALPRDTYWLYADDDLAGYTKVARCFGDEWRLHDAKAFQIEISRTTGEFLKWVDSVLADCPPDYWITASYFKDMFCTPMFLHLACLRMAAAAAARDRHVVVVTRSQALARQLRQLANVRSLFADIPRGGTLREWGSACLHFVGRPWLVCLRAWLARKVLGRRYHERLSNTELLVDTFLFPEDIGTDGRYSDRFFPGLVEWYRAQGIRAVSMPFTGNIPLHKLHSVYRCMRASDMPFAPGDFFLSVTDCAAGMWRALCASIRAPDFSAKPFAGIPIASLALHWWKLSALETVTYHIWRRVPRRMAEYGLRPGNALEWYENQPLDKAITLGFQKDCPWTTVIAGRQYFPAAGMVSFFSTSGEVRAGAAPRLNWACGKRIAALFASHDTLGHYEVVPALRYAHLFEHPGGTEEGTKLVVFLTSAREESLGILECIFSAAPEATAGFEAIIVKTHQALRGNVQEEAGRRWPAARGPSVIWEQRTTSELLGEAKLVLTAGSSVALEAVCRGVPVIVVGRHAGINLNPLESIDTRLWQIAYGSTDFENAIQSWLPTIPDWKARCGIGKDILDRYLEIATPKSMLAFDPRRYDNLRLKESMIKP
jgi:hypothetical protein